MTRTEQGSRKEIEVTGESEDDRDEYDKLIHQHVSMLMEHFDSVFIFGTRQDNDSMNPRFPRGITVNCCRGGGNFYASLGQIWEWVKQQDQRAREVVMREDDELAEDDQ